MELKTDGSIEADEVEVPGVIRDAYGNSWTVPVDEASYAELLTDPLKLPRKDPAYHYQFVRGDQVVAKSTEGFVLVNREEVGIDTPVTQADVGGPSTTVHQVHDLFLMKMPQVLADRRYRAQKRVADEAVQQILDPPKMADTGGEKHQFTRGPEPFETEAKNPGLSNWKEPKGSKEF